MCCARKRSAQRVLLAQHLELAGELGVPAERKLRVDPRLDRLEPELLQAARLGVERQRAADVGVRVAAPERQRLSQRLGRLRVDPSAASSRACATACSKTNASTCSGSTWRR